MKRAALALFLFAGACVETTPQQPTPCEEAAAHLDACLPGLVAERPATCDADGEAQADWVLSRSCDQLLADASSGKADAIPTLQGVRIRREGNRTYFSIPLARTSASDRGHLFDEMIAKFKGRMGELNSAMIAHGVDLSGLLVGDTATQFLTNYNSTIDAIIGTDTSRDVAVALGETVNNPTRLSMWQRYVIPQAFVAYFSAKFSANLGIGGGVSATVMIVVQPWLTLAVDHTLAQPKVVSKTYDVDVAVLGAPNVDIGFGAGGGGGLRLGLGAIFGPLDQPQDAAGWGIGLSGTVTVPVLGGISAKMITILKYPPMFLMMLGYSSGTSAEAEIHGNLQKLLDLEAFLVWISASVGGA